MARKRKPLVVNGETVALEAPGLDIRERENGTRVLYWIATVQARKRGYLPRTVRLHYDLANPMDRRELI